jgi:hypothetical protein
MLIFYGNGAQQLIQRIIQQVIEVIGDFMMALCSQLLHSNDTVNKEEELSSLPIVVLHRHHKQIHQKSYGRCEWGKLHSPGCPRKISPKKRKFGTDITHTTNHHWRQ